MKRLGIRVKRSEIAWSKIMRCYEVPEKTVRTPGKNVTNRKLAKALTKKAGDLERVRRITRAVVNELYKKNPAATAWAIRKGLNPGFKVGEVVNFTQNGKTVKGVIKSIGDVGATVQSLEWPRLVNYVPGPDVRKTA